MGGPLVQAQPRERHTRDHHPAGAARRRALEKLRNILRGLDQAAANERALIINDQLLPCLRQLHELPSGSSLDELQEEIKDPEIVALLQQARATVYSGSKTELESYAVLKKLCPMLLLGLSLLPFVLHAATPVMTLFEKGQYEDCLAQLLHPEKQLRADIAYQRGSTYYRMGDFARAYGAFAQAERLLPNNAAIQHNLSLTQQRLDISVNKPLILWRLRPDQYWTMAGIALFLCFFLKRTWLRKIAGLMALAALAGGSYNCMNHYHPDNALIIRASSLHRLPAVSTVQSGTQAAGQTVRLLDQADDPQGNAWYYVRLQDQVGWLPATDLQPLFKQTEPQKISPEAEGVEIEL